MGVVASALAKVMSAVRVKAEGGYRPGPWVLPITGGFLPADVGRHWNWWQLGFSPSSSSQSAMVSACVDAYSQTVAMCPGAHWLKLDNGGRERVMNSALSRILRKPNSYQTPSDFMLNATRSLYLHGNAYALALRNVRYEIDELHLMDPRQSSPAVTGPGEDLEGDAIEGGEIFYRLGGNTVIEYRLAELGDRAREAEQLMVPARDVLHIRLHSVDRMDWPFPLVGDTPLSAVWGDIATYEKIKNQQDQFYQNQARPSAVLTTDLNLSREQVAELRDRWNDQAKGLHAGGVPILTQGLKVMPWTQPPAARDMQVAELLKLTQDHIALAYRVPLAILGIGRASGSTTEQLRSDWRAGGLGFCLNHIEEAFDKLFDLRGQPDEYTEFDTEALMRSARKDRIDMLVRGVQGGVFSPNEARAQEDLPAVDYGDEPRVQQQVVPLSAAAAIQPSPFEPAPAVPAAPPAAGVPSAAGLCLSERPAPEKADDECVISRRIDRIVRPDAPPMRRVGAVPR
jgi:HK97 family phage portal protein